MKKVKIYFLVIFLLILYLPLVFINFYNNRSEEENRWLAGFPHTLDLETFKSLDEYFKDRIGFKKQLVNLNALVQYKILNHYGNRRAIIGKNDWLYYISPTDGDNLKDFLKENLVSDDTLAKFTKTIKEKSDWCKENDIYFIFLIAPSKHNIYPENFPLDRPAGLSRADQFVEALEQNNINFIYPKDLLLENKNKMLLYHETDTHWNKNATFLVFNLLKEKFVNEFKWINFPDVKYNVSIKLETSGGDLTPILGFSSGSITKVEYVAETEVVLDDSLPKAIVFHDSFFRDIKPFTSTIFLEPEYIWEPFEDSFKEHILEEKPDIIIWEVAERYLSRIINVN